MFLFICNFRSRQVSKFLIRMKQCQNFESRQVSKFLFRKKIVNISWHLSLKRVTSRLLTLQAWRANFRSRPVSKFLFRKKIVNISWDLSLPCLPRRRSKNITSAASVPHDPKARTSGLGCRAPTTTSTRGAPRTGSCGISAAPRSIPGSELESSIQFHLYKF